jgi:hypothetical protein
MMKINIPGDYHSAFLKAIEVALLIEQGKPSMAFSLIGFSSGVIELTKEWSHPIEARSAFMKAAEELLSEKSYKPESGRHYLLESLKVTVAALPVTSVIVVDDAGAELLHQSLETFSRLSMAQISDAFELVAFGSRVRNISEQDKDIFIELYHESVRISGHSLGISSTLINDNARNVWIARKVIQRHLAYKRKPAGGFTNAFDMPTRIGSCTDQDVTIQDPEFSISRTDFSRF